METQSSPTIPVRTSSATGSNQGSGKLHDGIIALRTDSANASTTGQSLQRAARSLDDQIQRVDEIQRQLSEERQKQRELTQFSPEPNRMVGFFLVLFLFGQGTSAWAFISSDITAWVCGIVFSVFGLSIALFSLVGQIETHRKEISLIKSDLARQNERTLSQSRTPTEQFTPKITANEKVIA